jgi:hypothetical protein
MKAEKGIGSKFSINLFWDINPEKLDMERNKRFIIQRVLEYGKLSDWQFIKNHYGVDVIGQEMTQVRNLDAVTLSFISKLAGINKNKFRCYTLKQSLPQHWDF